MLKTYRPIKNNQGSFKTEIELVFTVLNLSNDLIVSRFLHNEQKNQEHLGAVLKYKDAHNHICNQEYQPKKLYIY